MEIEMKAPITRDQIDLLVNHFEDSDHYYERADTYYSFNGEKVGKPKNLIRTRSERDFYLIDIFKEGLDKADTIMYTLKNDFLRKETHTEHTWLTVKAKNTNPEGIETNEEVESLIGDGTAFKEAMTIANFKPYFHKIKKSFSFYMGTLHCEIVSVDNIGPYLEIEKIVDAKNAEDFSKKVPEVQQLIKDVFKEIGITEFDGRSWPVIIEAVKEHQVREEAFNNERQTIF